MLKKFSHVSYQLSVVSYQQMEKQKFRKLAIWNKSIDFIKEVYSMSEKFPAKEIYGLTSQLRRAAVSIALNISEGSGSGSDKEFKRFLTISLRSSYEVMCAVEIGFKLGYCDNATKIQLLNSCDELSAMISGLTKKLIADSR